MSQGSKHQTVRNYICELIQSGKFRVGQQLPTDGQLMRQFGVSRPTVAKAMLDLERQGLLDRRPGAGSYVRHSSTAKGNNMIGLLIPGLGETEIFEPICAEIARVCPKYNFNLIWGDFPLYDPAQLAELAMLHCQQYIDEKYSGIIWAPIEHVETMGDLNLKMANMFEQAGIPVVLLDRDIEDYPKRSRFDLIGIDNFRAGFVQTQHMIALGKKRIAYFAKRMSAPTVAQRILGYYSALSQHHLYVNDQFVVLGNPDNSEAVDHLLDLEPDAVVCANDITAGTLMRTLLDKGCSIPKEIAMIGLDGVRYANLFPISLTTLIQPCREIGLVAINALIQRIENKNLPPRDIRLNFSMKIRQSCGANLNSMSQ